MQAVGRCNQCEKAFCGSHGGTSGGLPVADRCGACLHREQSAHRDARFGSVSEREPQIAEVVAATTHATERLVRALGRFAVVVEQRAYGPGGRVGTKAGVMRGTGYYTSDLRAIESVCPGWNPSMSEHGNWDDEEVAAWFADYAVEHGVSPESVQMKEPVLNWLGKPKHDRAGTPVVRLSPPVPGWVIPAALLGSWMPAWDSPVKPPDDGLIDTTGRADAPLPAAALWYLAKLLGFPLKHADVMTGPS